jgi:hypothetical protein
VDELIISFTHDREIDYLLPGIAPTGKYVEIPHVVIMKFKIIKSLMSTYNGINLLSWSRLDFLTQRGYQ